MCAREITRMVWKTICTRTFTNESAAPTKQKKKTIAIPITKFTIHTKGAFALNTYLIRTSNEIEWHKMYLFDLSFFFWFFVELPFDESSFSHFLAVMNTRSDSLPLLGTLCHLVASMNFVHFDFSPNVLCSLI